MIIPFMGSSMNIPEPKNEITLTNAIFMFKKAFFLVSSLLISVLSIAKTQIPLCPSQTTFS